MGLFKKAVIVAALSAAGFAAAGGSAFAGEPADSQDSIKVTAHAKDSDAKKPTHGKKIAHGSDSNDNNVVQQGLVPVNALNNANVSPNLGCVANRPLEDLNAQSLVGLVPVAVDVDELAKQPHINVLSNGNVSTTIEDNSCTSNQGSSQAGDNTHGATGAGSSSNGHAVGNAAGSDNTSGNGGGGLIGSAGHLLGGKK
ncbi:hypothetical protein [Kibdelosporangium phytohabitans]|uniref:Secreted protein n=2 Tax=Kibdelosporangium phytohabitans TaxID=860235 RepID=A0A0N9I1I1_9PSEU|nr:hypothetical protein [Kibdelosporangium phytohabitans]ALG08290.1 hypothetical protein AOZ06_16470 [Kibdelosporangium phytohabitans]MBE1470684.1 hypothetical protein [Kibdelosporangium phytohabitans]